MSQFVMDPAEQAARDARQIMECHLWIALELKKLAAAPGIFTVREHRLIRSWSRKGLHTCWGMHKRCLHPDPGIEAYLQGKLACTISGTVSTTPENQNGAQGD